MAENSYDIIIVGGGMVGASLACALGGTPFNIAVVESQPALRPGDAGWDDAVYDIRVSAITRATQRLFEAVGAWEGMVAKRVAPYRQMHVWDETGSGSIDFAAADLAEVDLGHIIENRVILAALLARMADFDNIELLCPAEVSALERRSSGAVLTLADGRALSGKLIVGADGANSWVRDQGGIRTTGWMYEQTAVVATIRHSRPHEETAYQRFMPQGPLAFLPLDDPHLSSIVWSTTPERAAELVAMETALFLDELQLTFGDSLGRMEGCGPRGGFPLQLKHANSYCSDRLVLVGNAAHAIHPLAGQGLNLGASDVAALAEILLEAHGAKRDIGDYELLRRYERWRKADNVAVMAAMDGFKRLFSNDIGPLKLVRNLGLNLADASGPLKKLMMKKALGVSGDLPKLSRGQPL